MQCEHELPTGSPTDSDGRIINYFSKNPSFAALQKLVYSASLTKCSAECTIATDNTSVCNTSCANGSVVVISYSKHSHWVKAYPVTFHIYTNVGSLVAAHL